MNKKFVLALRIVGPTIVGIIFSLITYKILDVSFLSGGKEREIILVYSVLFGVVPIASILAGMLSKIWLHRIWVSIFNVVGIWIVFYFIANQSIYVVPFLPIYMFCGFLAALVPSSS